jgi:hypothetical protein
MKSYRLTPTTQGRAGENMTNDRRQLALQNHLVDLIADEAEMVQALERQMTLWPEQPEASKTLTTIHASIKGQGELLTSHLGVPGGSVNASPRRPIGSLIESTLTGSHGAQSLSSTLRADYAAFNYMALGYAGLFEMSLRLYVPALREIAPEHMQNYAAAAHAVSHVTAPMVARELLQDDLSCSCICPMCSIGACGCVSVCIATIDDVWRVAATSADSIPGFPLPAPRPGSQLALAGVQGGDRLLEVDGRPVQKVADIQAAIRRHALGEDVQLRVMRTSDGAREVIAKHVSDYPRD